MNFDWRTATLSEVATTRNGAGVKQEFYAERGVPLARVTNFTDNSIDLGGAIEVDEEHAKKWRGHQLRTGDILIATVGSWPPNWASVVGKAVTVPKTAEGAIQNQNTCCIQAIPEKSEQRFLYYIVRSQEFIHYAANTASGSANQARLTVGKLGDFSFMLPSLGEQRSIAALLGALDDRVTLLRETNVTLEAIAQALFKSWFVDFEPVRTKLEGRVPEGMDEATAALFPDGFEESELGPVPIGWRVGMLQDLLFLQRGFDLPSQERRPGGFPIIAASGPSGTHFIRMVKGPGLVTGRSGVLGRVFLELEDFWPLNTTLWVKEFRAATPCFAYELLKRLDFQSFNAGSAVPTLNRNHIHSLRYLIPPRACIEAYEQLALQLHVRVRANSKQADTLAALRDMLLPRLISGQLRLSEATAEFEAIAA